MMTAAVDRRIVETFAANEREAARAELVRIEDVLRSTWREVAETDRVELAALTLACGDLSKLRDAVELALVDWRDVLVAARG